MRSMLPTERSGNNGSIIITFSFPLLLLGCVDLAKKKYPRDFLNTLRIAIDTRVIPYDIIGSFDKT